MSMTFRWLETGYAPGYPPGLGIAGVQGGKRLIAPLRRSDRLAGNPDFYCSAQEFREHRDEAARQKHAG
jgi:hypothetical protein